MRIAIIDDNLLEQEKLRNCISNWMSKENITVSIDTYESGTKFVGLMKYTSHDIIFIDIIMDGKNGIETAKALRQRNIESLIIFITTSREYMADAFPCHAFDYIVKPYTCERIYKVLNEARRALKKLDEVIDISNERFIISDILYVYSDSNYCNIYTTRGVSKVRMSFTELSEKLTICPSFYVVSRGAAVNFDNVTQISDSECVMKNGERVPISRRKIKEVERKYMDRQFASMLERGY